MARKIRWEGDFSPSQTVKKEEKMPTEIDIDALMKKDVDDLTPEELKIRLKNTEAKIAELRLDSSMHSDGRNIDEIGPDDLVTITVPSSPMGDIYNLNWKYYPPGRHQVPKRVAQHLAYVISESWKIERERLMSRTNKFSGSLLRGEDIARIERFEQIMKN